MLPADGALVNPSLFGHILPMLDVLRERERPPERTFSPREFRAIADRIDLPKTPANMLALMLAIGTGRFPRIEFADEA